VERRDGGQRVSEFSVDPLHGAVAEKSPTPAARVFVTSGAANKASAYLGPYAGLESSTGNAGAGLGPGNRGDGPCRANLFDPGPIRNAQCAPPCFPAKTR